MAICVKDQMTDTNWRDLHTHVGAVGATWTRHPATPSTRWYIFGNQVHCGVAGAIYASGVPASANYTVSCDYTIYTDIAAIGIAGRMSTVAMTMYYCYYLNQELVLAKQVNGAITSLGVWLGTLDGGGATHELELSMIGTAIKVFVNGVERISVVDSSITAAGRAAVRSPGSNDAGTGKHIDNFTATDTSTPPARRSRFVGLIGL